ncbi:MAG: long-chain fatty acid--CoA ligase [Planctomycetes bacterium]|nr:long-chain fatty acid--CoA ligase [Planctomycetota bacterium]
MAMNLATQFAATARRLPDKVAVADDAGEHTYRALLAAAEALAGRIRSATERQTVGLLAPTCAAFPVGYFATLLADKVPVPLNFLFDAKTLAFVAADAAFDTVVAARAFANLVPMIGAKAVFVEDPAEPPAEARLPRRGGDDVATILYTSGTTGLPKGVILTHRNFARNVESSTEHIGITEEDVFLGVLPFFHSFGITTSMLIPLLAGCSAALVARFSPHKMLEAVARHRATICFAVGSMFRVVLRAGRPPGLDLSSLKFAVAGGEALGAPTAAAFEATFGAPLLEGYGLTETSPVLAVNLPNRNRQGSVGPMLNWVQARVVDDADQPLPTGAEGELWVRGDCVTPGYHNRPEETAAAITPDGWLRTGDIARIDADGYLWITGRKKDLIISAGENISPNEIESVLHDHPAVLEAAVLGVPDPTRGEAPKAFVTLREGATASADDLAAFCRTRLPRFKVPTAFEFLPQLPHSATGKVHKLALKKTQGLR